MDPKTKQIPKGEGTQADFPEYHDFDEIATLLDANANPEAVEKALGTYIANLTRPGYLEQAEKLQVALIRQRVETLLEKPKGPKHKKTRRALREAHDKLSRIEETKQEQPQREEGHEADAEGSKTEVNEPPVSKALEEPPTPKKLEISDKNLQKMAEKVAPRVYKNWCDLFQALHYSDSPALSEGRFIKQYIGIEDEDEYKRAKNALWKNGFKKYLETENPARALNEALGDGELSEQTLAQKINEKIREIKKIVEAIKRKTQRSPDEAPAPSSVKKSKTPGPVPVSTDAKLKPGDTFLVMTETIDSSPYKDWTLFAKAADYLIDKPEERALLISTLKLLAAETADPWVTDLQARIKLDLKSKEFVQKAMPDSEQPIVELFNGVLKPLEKEINNALEGLEDREFYTTMGLGKIEKEFMRVFSILSINPDDIVDARKRRHFQSIQAEVKAEMESIKRDFPRARLQTLRLAEQTTNAEEIAKRIAGLNQFIEYFEKEILPNLPQRIQELYQGAPVIASAPAGTTTVTTAPSSGAAPAPSASPAPIPATVPAPVSVPVAAPLPTNPAARRTVAPVRPRATYVSNTPRRAGRLDQSLVSFAEKGKIPELSEKTKKMLDALLSRKELIRDEDPACLAINALLSGSRVDIDELMQFLQNPELLDNTISPEMRQAVEVEMGKVGAGDYIRLKRALEAEKEEIAERLALIQGHKPSADEVIEIKEKLARKSEIGRLLKITDSMICIEKRTMTYESPRELLGYINFYLHKDEQGRTVQSLSNDVNDQIEAQKERLYKGFSVNKALFFFRPLLKSTLKALAEDTAFTDLGDNPEEKLEQLSKVSGNYTKVREWANSLPGKLNAHIHSTIPRLIAYLEIAIREGKMSSILNVGAARKLVENLKKLQHENIRLEVEREFRSKPSMSNQEKMLLYLEKLNSESHNVVDLNTKILSKHVRKAQSLKASMGLGLVTAGILSPLSFVATLPTFFAIPAFAASYTKSVPEKYKPYIRNAAIRTAVANGIAMGVMALGAGTPIGWGVAGLGLIGEQVWRYKRRKSKKSS